MAHKDMYGRRTYSVKRLDEAIEASGMTPAKRSSVSTAPPSLRELALLR